MEDESSCVFYAINFIDQYVRGDQQQVIMVLNALVKEHDNQLDDKIRQPDEKSPHDALVSDDPLQSSSISVQSTPKRTWRSYLWDTFDKSPEERRFLFKLDAVILTFASLGYFIKYLDQVNINNAYVSGMKEDLNLHGNELNYMTTIWTVGYVIGEVPM